MLKKKSMQKKPVKKVLKKPMATRTKKNLVSKTRKNPVVLQKKERSLVSAKYFVIIAQGGTYKYFNGADFVDSKDNAAEWSTKQSALNVAQLLAKKLNKPVGVLTDSKKN
jgi:beta-xylosidase